jgi:hypothetical protein
MNKFLKGIFEDKDGSPSSKRIILFLFVVVFVFICIVNLFTGKSLSQTLTEQLFYLVIYTLAAVFGENITDLFKKKNQPPTP